MALTLLRVRCGKGKGRVAREAGIQRGQLIAYERGETVPRPETLARLALALGTAKERIEAMADALAAAPGLLEPAALSGLEAALLPPIPPPARTVFRNPEEERAAAEALWLRLRPYTAVQRRAIVLETPEFHLRALSERLRQENEAVLAELVASLAPQDPGA
jgi:transcriptional regulator with XRE-family HTH domain